jgi:hypothetical protein
MDQRDKSAGYFEAASVKRFYGSAIQNAWQSGETTKAIELVEKARDVGIAIGIDENGPTAIRAHDERKAREVYERNVDQVVKVAQEALAELTAQS